MSNSASHAKPIRRSGNNSATRREFLARMRGSATAAVASSAVSFRSPAKAGEGPDDEHDSVGTERVLDSYEVREQAARAETKVPIPRQITNGDEQRYQNQNYIGNYSKGLMHNSLGEVIPNAYRDLLNALGEGTAAAFEKKSCSMAAPSS